MNIQYCSVTTLQTHTAERQVVSCIPQICACNKYINPGLHELKRREYHGEVRTC